MTRPVIAVLATAIALSSVVPRARAAEPFTFLTNWYAQAEHGGFYQALAEGLYEKRGLSVTIRMGGPQVNTMQIMAASQADCVVSSSDVQVMQTRAGGVPVVATAAFFQKDPTVLIAHEGVSSLDGLKGKTILLSASANRTWWPWLKTRYGLNDGQTRPYTFNIQPFLADPDAVQQGYVTSDPFVIEKAGVKANVLLLGDYGYPAYANLVACMDKTVHDRRQQVAAFIEASAEGWKSYLANPAPGNGLIKADNPKMTDELLAYGLAKIKQAGLVAGGDAATGGIGIITAAREKATYDFLVAEGLLDPAKLPPDAAFTTGFSHDAKVLP